MDNTIWWSFVFLSASILPLQESLQLFLTSSQLLSKYLLQIRFRRQDWIFVNLFNSFQLFSRNSHRCAHTCCRQNKHWRHWYHHIWAPQHHRTLNDRRMELVWMKQDPLLVPGTKRNTQISAFERENDILQHCWRRYAETVFTRDERISLQGSVQHATWSTSIHTKDRWEREKMKINFVPRCLSCKESSC